MGQEVYVEKTVKSNRKIKGLHRGSVVRLAEKRAHLRYVLMKRDHLPCLEIFSSNAQLLGCRHQGGRLGFH